MGPATNQREENHHMFDQSVPGVSNFDEKLWRCENDGCGFQHRAVTPNRCPNHPHDDMVAPDGDRR